MSAVLEYPDVSIEHKGQMNKGRLKLTDSNLVFKNNKTGKVEQLASGDIDIVTWQRFAGAWGLRIFAKSGSLLRFGGMKESDKDKVSKFFETNYGVKVIDKEFSLRGWNWGTAKFAGAALTFDISRDPAFDVPLGNVSQCTTGKNEVTLEFHQNDDAPVSLMEMRFHIPSSELAGDDPVEAFREQVMGKASIISAVGDAIAIFREVACLTPRGRYDIKMFPQFFQLHGKTFDYKIPMSTILRMFILPHKDGRQTFFVISLDPPIKQGQTRYHYLVFVFSQEDEDISIELPFSEQELKTKYDGKLTKEMEGPMFEVISRVFKALVNRKVTAPGKFSGHSGTPAIGCSYKSAVGYLYPLERGFIYVHKPPMHIRFEEVASVNFARSGGSTRSFDFEIELKNGIVHTFSSIEKEEYHKLFDFITEKKLRVKNRGKMDKPSYTGDFDDSDAEAEPDAYLARVKAEAEERSEEEDESSEDEDYNPDKDKNKPKEDGSGGSSALSSDAESEDYDPDEVGSDMDSNSKSKPKKSKSSGEKRVKKSKKDKKQGKDSDAPKRPQSAYFLWMNANREAMKKKHPGLSVTEMSKVTGEAWRGLSAEDKKEWEDKAKKAKEHYDEEMKEYRKNAPTDSGSKKKSKSGGGGGGAKASSSGSKKTTSPKKKSSDTGGSGTGFKSKEFISDSDSSDSDAGDKKGKKKKKGAAAAGGGGDKDKAEVKGKDKAKPTKKATKPSSDSDAEKSGSESGSGSASAGGGGSDSD